MNTNKRYTPEVRERAVWVVLKKHYPTWREALVELNELPLASEGVSNSCIRRHKPQESWLWRGGVECL